MSNFSVSHKNRNAIIDALKELIKQYPYNEITMKEIASEANVVRRTIYGHFADKDAILNAAISDFFEQFIERLQESDFTVYNSAFQMFTLVELNIDVFKAYRRSNLLVPTDELNNYMRYLFEQNPENFDSKADLSEKELEILFNTGGMMNLLNHWLVMEHRPTPSKMACLFENLVSGKRHLDNSKSSHLVK